MDPRRLTLTAVGIALAVLWFLQLYGWHRYHVQLEQLNAVLIPAVDESTRNLLLLAPQVDFNYDCDPSDSSIYDLLGSADIEGLVRLRDSLLAIPDECSQIRGMAAGTEVILTVVKSLDTGELSPETLAGYLELGQGVGWDPLMAQWVTDICVETPPPFTLDWATNWAAGGYAGALCVGTLRGVYNATEKPADDDSTAQIIRDGCQEAFLGAGWYCLSLDDQDSFVSAVELRRVYLRALQQTQQCLEAAMEAEGREEEDQVPRRRNTEEVAV